ncbi:T9SS C-terminal target domain-containing protein [Aquimarina sp. AD1]|uniref:beta strand repeat-containing protein n=1 Tax=Aquimarina sp. (strain AD1) TaxID=1714848 RepID=UPI000EAAC0DF|nr:Ig-like domain-containing protein [Aquimarina sp. AD1]RKN29833.1 T9SS C-terminal target domain-containing protein [Aquimarina sp. AD1]
MKTILLKILCPFALGLISSICYSQVGTNFSEPTAVSAVYSDPNTTTHQLSNNVSQPTVEYVFGTNGSTELGFKTRFIATRTGTSGSSGLSDGDLIGVVPGTTFQNGAPSTTGAAGFLIGSGNVFMIEDPDGTIQIEFDEVDLSSTINPQLSLKYGIRSATYENTDGANDRFFVALQVDGNPNFVTILDSDGDGTEGGNNATGNDIDGQLTEGSEQTINFSLVPYIGSKVKLIIEADFNAASEEVAIDDIVFSEGSIATSNNAPIATAPSAPTLLEDAINVALADNIQVADTDGDDQTVTFTITGGTVTLGTAGITFGGSGNGSASFTAAGTLANINAALDAATFTPTPNLNGTNAGTISFTTNDGTDTSSPASITFDITAVNDDPTITGLSASVTVTEDTQSNVDLSTASFADVDSASITVTLTASTGTFVTPADGAGVGGGVTETLVNATVITLVGAPADINTYLDTASNIQYTPAMNVSGNAAATITVTTNDGDGSGNINLGTVNINVTAVNDEPSFTAGANETINEDAGTQTVNGWATAIDDGDADATQTLTFTVTNDNNALFSAQPAIDATGNLTYTPAPNANGTATVDVVLSDDGGTANGGDDTFATQQFTITVNAVNDEPSFTAGANETINEDAGAQTVNGWATAIDDGDSDAAQTLTFTVTNDNNALFSAQPAIDATGNLTYTPAPNANGTATVDVVLSDDGGTANGGDDTFATQQFTITVNAVNDEPSFTAGANETINEDAGAQTVNGWATAIDDGDADATQTLTFTVTNDNNALFSSQPAIDATGNLTYTPAANANGSATVNVVLSDDGGTANGGDDTFATQQFTITVNAVNDEPSFTAGANEAVNEDAGAQTVNVWATAIDDGDAEAMQTLTFTVTNDNNALFSTQPAIDATGNLTYTPAADANGTATVDIVLSDDGGTANGGDDTFATQQFTITVNAVNDEPSFTPGANETVNEDAGAQTVNGWATAIDDGDSEAMQTLTFTVTNDNNALFSIQPAIDVSGNLTYTPAASATGAAIVDVILSDNGGTANGGDDTFATQQFTITVSDITPPMVSITSSEPNPTNNSSFEITINFNEDITGFDISDIIVGNGTAANLSGGGLSYTATITATTPGTITVDINANSVNDLSGNGNIAATQFSIIYDNLLDVNDETLANGLTVYPTPSNNIINITGAIDLDIERTEIFDIRGKLILSQKLDPSSIINTIDISSIPSGLYLMRIYSKTSSTMKRVVKK